MKVLFYHLEPFALAHGGLQIQVHRTLDALRKLGAEAEFLRWWDGGQSGDILHFFGRIPTVYLRWAQQKGMRIVQAELLTEQGSRTTAQRRLQKFLRWSATRVLSRRRVDSLFHWDSYRLAEASIALTHWEAQLMKELFGAPPERVHVVPNGAEEVFLNSEPKERGPWLICTATITERKRVVELAEAAVHAETPLWIIGKPYSESDPYAQCFFSLVKAHPTTLRYEGPISDRTRLAAAYREARGFVLLSAMESLSLSALEAAACQCALLLSQLPWATTVFKDRASYCPVLRSPDRTAAFLRQFYDAAPGLKPPPKPLSWIEVGRRLKEIYESVPSSSR